MAEVISVSALNQYVKTLLDANDILFDLALRGEIANFVQNSRSGHCYFSLRDEASSVKAVMFRSDAMRLKFRLQNGMKVIVRARVSSFPRTGAVQLYISEIIPDGAGALNVAFEQLKAKLQAEGLFAEAHKKPIPACPSSIPLVTSPTGAAVRDMIRILGRRWPLAKVVLYPAQVQGQGAAESIARALALANAIGEADVILCGRGGGSMEDLWAFNEEVTARAIYASEIPVISAVGHEPDVTIADLRAPTPSGAAELAVPDRADWKATLEMLDARLRAAAGKQTQMRRRQLQSLSERLSVRTPVRYIAEKRLVLDTLTERLQGTVPARLAHERQQLRTAQDRLLAAGRGNLHRARLRFTQTVASLDAMSPLRVLSRGYAVATKGARGAVVTDAAALKEGDALHIRFAKGAADCRVIHTEEEQ